MIVDGYKRFIPITNPMIWPQLLHFHSDENWGDADKMDVRLLWNLDKVRDDLARRIIINCGYSHAGHAAKSFHKFGMAVDLYVENTQRDELLNLYFHFLTIWRGGVGVYPFWNKPGFHLDIGPSRSWVRDKDGKYHSDINNIAEITKSIAKS